VVGLFFEVLFCLNLVPGKHQIKKSKIAFVIGEEQKSTKSRKSSPISVF
jgi:hypothetical protein